VVIWVNCQVVWEIPLQLDTTPPPGDFGDGALIFGLSECR
jgi:hypothetical protein